VSFRERADEALGTDAARAFYEHEILRAHGDLKVGALTWERVVLRLNGSSAVFLISPFHGFELLMRGEFCPYSACVANW